MRSGSERAEPSLRLAWWKALTGIRTTSGPSSASTGRRRLLRWRHGGPRHRDSVRVPRQSPLPGRRRLLCHERPGGGDRRGVVGHRGRDHRRCRTSRLTLGALARAGGVHGADTAEREVPPGCAASRRAHGDGIARRGARGRAASSSWRSRRTASAPSSPTMQPLADGIEAVVSLAKGIEMGTNLRMSQVVGEVLPGVPAGVLTGPNLAREVAQGHPAACVVALADEELASRVQALVHTRTFRTYMGTDVVGCEIAGATKNVMAIAAGIGDGLGLGDNTRAVLITRGLAELGRLGVALGGKVLTFGGLAGVGDLVATCASPQSRNRTVGFALGEGQSLDDIVGRHAHGGRGHQERRAPGRAGPGPRRRDADRGAGPGHRGRTLFTRRGTVEPDAPSLPSRVGRGAAAGAPDDERALPQLRQAARGRRRGAPGGRARARPGDPPHARRDRGGDRPGRRRRRDRPLRGGPPAGARRVAATRGSRCPS